MVFSSNQDTKRSEWLHRGNLHIQHRLSGIFVNGSESTDMHNCGSTTPPPSMHHACTSKY